jgi:hypothetical protein
MSSAPIKDHLGVTVAKEESDDPKKLRNPIPRTKGENLRELVGWIAGSDTAAPVISDSRQLTTLGEVIATPQALNALRAGGNLESAKQLTAGEENRIATNFTKASYFLDEVLKDAHRYKKSKKIQSLFKRCEATLSEIKKTLT